MKIQLDLLSPLLVNPAFPESAKNWLGTNGDGLMRFDCILFYSMI